MNADETRILQPSGPSAFHPRLSAAKTRLKLILAYDGIPFRGWQSQTGGNTIQDHLEGALKKICGTPVVVHGAGRTDAGVHALAQCAHADVTRTLENWPRALNANLPREIRVLKCTRAKRDFHARFSAREKTYEYRIWNAEEHSPFELGRSWHVPGLFDVHVLKRGTAKLIGTHDFAGFAANRGKPETDTRRTLYAIDAKRAGSLVTLRFRGNGFLYKMVRLLTGALVRCAQGRADIDSIDSFLARKRKCSFAAPAHGLYLRAVKY